MHNMHLLPISFALPSGLVKKMAKVPVTASGVQLFCTFADDTRQSLETVADILSR